MSDWCRRGRRQLKYAKEAALGIEAAPSRIVGVPAPEAFGPAAPLAATLEDVQDGVEDLMIQPSSGTTEHRWAAIYCMDAWFDTVASAECARSLRRLLNVAALAVGSRSIGVCLACVCIDR